MIVDTGFTAFRSPDATEALFGTTQLRLLGSGIIDCVSMEIDKTEDENGIQVAHDKNALVEADSDVSVVREPDGEFKVSS